MSWRTPRVLLISAIFSPKTSNFCEIFGFVQFWLLLSGDWKGPKPSSCDEVSICHWNLNRISGHNFIKIYLLRAYISTHTFDMLCLLETYLDSSTSSDGDNLTIPDYDLYRVDHPSNVKHGEVCIYYKKFLPLKVIDFHYQESEAAVQRCS